MAYSVDWIGKSVFVPVSDMTLVSGTEYDLNLTSFLTEIRRLEWVPSEGLWAPHIVEHTNQKTLAGVTYFSFDEIVNGYTVTLDPTATRVNLKGPSNNNIVDVMVVNGVSVVPSNTAGGSVTETGTSGLTPTESTAVIATNNMATDLWHFKGCDASNPVDRGGDQVTEETLTVDGKVLTITPAKISRS